MGFLGQALAYFSIRSMMASLPRLLERAVIDQWLGEVLREIRKGHTGYAFGGPSINAPNFYCELSRQSLPGEVVVIARILTVGRQARFVASHEWRAKELAPDLARAFGLNQRIKIDL